MKKSILLCLMVILQALNCLPLYSQTPSAYWARRFGGGDTDYGRHSYCDQFGNSYFIGAFISQSINVAGNVLINADNQQLSTDEFIVRYNRSGTATFVKKISSSYDDTVLGLVVDAEGNIYITGAFVGTSLTLGSTTLNNSGGYSSELFVAKLDSTGNYIWVKGGQGTGGSAGTSVCVDTDGNLYLAGGFSSTSFTFDGISMNNIDTTGIDSFLAKIDAEGNTRWVVNFGGKGDVRTSEMVQDAASDLYIAGTFTSRVFEIGDTTVYNADTTESLTDVYLIKVDTTQNLEWIRSAGGKANEWIGGLCLNSFGYPCLSGSFYSASITFDTTTFTNAWPSETSNDGYVVCFNPNGKVVWGKTIGDIYDETCYGINAADNGSVVISGSFYSAQLILDGITLNKTGTETYYSDAYFASLDQNGVCEWALRVGSTDTEWGTDITVDPYGDYFITGSFGSNSVSVGGYVLNNVDPYLFDIFIAKLGFNIGIDENSLLIGDITIAPVPSQDILNISSNREHQKSISEATIIITDLQGKELMQSSRVYLPTSIDISNLAKGTYYLTIKEKSQTWSGSFVKL